MREMLFSGKKKFTFAKKIFPHIGGFIPFNYIVEESVFYKIVPTCLKFKRLILPILVFIDK